VGPPGHRRARPRWQQRQDLDDSRHVGPGHQFFNALFVLSRSVGFASHHLDQRRHGEGLLRLTDEDVAYLG
jgi:citrate synthase